MPKAKKVINKPFRALQLTIWITPRANGQPLVQATLKHKCVDKQSAVDLIGQYVKNNIRVKESEKH